MPAVSARMSAPRVPTADQRLLSKGHPRLHGCQSAQSTIWKRNRHTDFPGEHLGTLAERLRAALVGHSPPKTDRRNEREGPAGTSRTERARFRRAGKTADDPVSLRSEDGPLTLRRFEPFRMGRRTVALHLAGPSTAPNVVGSPTC